MMRAEIEELDDRQMNRRCAEIISRYWAQQGIHVEVAGGQGQPIHSNLEANGLPSGYRGEDAIRLPGVR